MGSLDRIKDALNETAQSAIDRTKQVRDAVKESAKEAREKVMGMADQGIAAGDKMVEMARGEPDALELIKKGHELVNRLFEQIEAIEDQQDDLCEGLFAQLEYALSTHAAMEEKLFYPEVERVRRDGDGQQSQQQSQEEVKEDQEKARELIAETREEHEIMKRLLFELTSMPLGGQEWKAKLTVLKENVLHHVQEEENEILPIAREKIGDERLMQLGRRMEEEKQALAAAGQPDEDELLAAAEVEETSGQRRQSGGPKSSRGRQHSQP